MKFQVVASDFRRQVEKAKRQTKADLRLAARVATDRASKHAQNHIRSKMRSVGLGKLGNAVGQMSSLKKDQKDKPAYGVIYAKGKTNDEDRGAAAIEAYSRGVTIRARNRTWLAYQTNAIPRRAGRFRMTPWLYKMHGWEGRLGKLEFRPIKGKKDMALLVAKKVTLHPKTGQAQRAGPRPPRARVPQDEVVVFVLIRRTRRARRFDEKQIVAQHARDVPKFMDDALRDIRGRRGAR